MMGFGFLGFIVLVIVIGTILTGSPAIARLFSSNWDSRGSQGDAQLGAKEILDQRYARGEISREEYQQAKQALGEG